MNISLSLISSPSSILYTYRSSFSICLRYLCEQYPITCEIKSANTRFYLFNILWRLDLNLVNYIEQSELASKRVWWVLVREDYSSSSNREQRRIISLLSPIMFLLPLLYPCTFFTLSMNSAYFSRIYLYLIRIEATNLLKIAFWSKSTPQASACLFTKASKSK